MICPTCQTLNRDGAKFCKNCRAALSASEADTLPWDGTAPENEAPVAVDVGQPAEPAASGVALDQDQPAAPDLSQAGPAVEESANTAPALPVAGSLRYEIGEIIEQSAERVIYRARDRWTCGQCGMLRADETDVFCWQCGAEIGSGAPCRAQVGDLPADVAPASLIVQNGTTYWVTPEPLSSAEPTAQQQEVRLYVGYATDPGQVREIDEDSLLVVGGVSLMEGVARTNVGVFAVADGMGGHDNGQLASRRVIQVVAEYLLPRLLAPDLGGETILEETCVTAVVDAIQEANRRLTAEARNANSNMGSTLTLAFVRNRRAVIANIGDSRTYVWQGGILRQVTKDHSSVARLVETGALQPEEIYTHPRRSEIYRVLGDKPEMDVDTFEQELYPGDRLVLCCDGVWEMIHTDGIEEVLLTCPSDPQAACDEMVRRANLAGGEDNISVIVVDVV
jgi:serine/threonine protein phosphatase PrpC